MGKKINKKLDSSIATAARLTELIARSAASVVLLTSFDQPWVIGVGAYLGVTAAIGFIYLVHKGVK